MKQTGLEIFDEELWIFNRNNRTQVLVHLIGDAGKNKIC